MSTESGSNDPSTLEAWRKSRSGAWAARGFHYQHLVSTLILLRQWAGLAPTGHLVPEGLEDCVIETHDQITWIQAKSRNQGKFRPAEVRGILDFVAAKAVQFSNLQLIRTAVILEQPPTGIAADDIDQLFDGGSGRVFLCSSPANDILDLLSSRLSVANVIAEGIASDLYRLVADASGANAVLSFDKRARISTTDIEHRIRDRLEAEDPSAIDEAIFSGILAPVDFATPVDEPGFYQGVKVRPGHIAAGLVLGRRADVNNVVDSLKQRRHVLLTGPSGAGKSALAWLSASSLAGEMRWFEVTSTAAPSDAQSVVRFVRSRRPTQTSPIALVFDDIVVGRSDLWSVLSRELRGLPAVYLLGSVREEDLSLIGDRVDTRVIPVALDAVLAETVWEKLTAQRETNWIHWREPFEQSKGLLLEYVHLLTQGHRLATVIGGQVRQRESDGRDDELAIIRSTTVLSVHGGEVDASKLFALLQLQPDAAGRALKRLLDEHLVLENVPGVLGGLHPLRSRALLDASDDEVIHISQNTLWRCLPAVTHGTLPRVIQSILGIASDEESAKALSALADVLRISLDVETWVATLTGLGLATLERHVASFIASLDQHGVPRAQWSVASMFVCSGVEVPALPQSEHLENLRNAIDAFRVSAKRDLRSDCLDRLPDGYGPPPCNTVSQANRVLSSLVPICGIRPGKLPLQLDFVQQAVADIREVATLLATAYAVSPERARSLIEEFGGQQALLKVFRSQIPWTTDPIVESCGPHGRTIRANWFHLAEHQHSDPHEFVCEICEILIALSPDADAAASDALDPTGTPIAIEERRPWSKNISRTNLPAKSLVAWNVAFRQILMSRVGSGALTEYAHRMAALVRRTEKVFRAFTERWIQGKRSANVDAWAAEANEIVRAVNALAYAEPQSPSPVMAEPVRSGGVDDTLGALLTGVLGNLLGRLGDTERAKSAATFAGDLATQALQHQRSKIWRTTTSPPSEELVNLENRLHDVSCILHELSHDSGPATLGAIRKTARKRRLNKSVAGAANLCRARAKRRFESSLRSFRDALDLSGHAVHCLSRPICEPDSPYWPAREVAILIEIGDLGPESLLIFEEGLELARRHLGDDWPYRAVPVIDGQILASLARCPSSNVSLPDQEFERNWAPHVVQPMASAASIHALDDGVNACNLISAILTCRGVRNLSPKEEAALSHSVQAFHRSRGEVADLVDRTGLEAWVLAIDYLDEAWNKVVQEYMAHKDQGRVENPMCMEEYKSLSGRLSDQVAKLAAIRLAIIEDELHGAASAVPIQ